MFFFHFPGKVLCSSRNDTNLIRKPRQKRVGFQENVFAEMARRRGLEVQWRVAERAPASLEDLKLEVRSCGIFLVWRCPLRGAVAPPDSCTCVAATEELRVRAAEAT